MYSVLYSARASTFPAPAHKGDIGVPEREKEYEREDTRRTSASLPKLKLSCYVLARRPSRARCDARVRRAEHACHRLATPQPRYRFGCRC
ncbi:hypothetical protein C8T65DRAFT_668797 [Cerioporus squamosus]|nr:hypothetical protein C8T65DRAFT_668797 [Cerioporus squamosus]